MARSFHPKTDTTQRQIYEIRVQGHLGNQWADWFENMSICLENCGSTTLTGPVADQAALHGLLRKIRDLGMPLLSLQIMGAAD